MRDQIRPSQLRQVYSQVVEPLRGTFYIVLDFDAGRNRWRVWLINGRSQLDWWSASELRIDTLVADAEESSEL